ncbi:nuclear transport factor 2 family protein [Agitococcus lubricus]|uniref:SnoaL-like protein n=1 Tax=Agitococcus lubricus TaxID=1077255 RepID=A0A2T5IVP7_9GAMM|nr:nuclear transport factor 2 family protein [Agitococcus lubricus]PTQ87901.1 SnoaL-like protein [Agitococcus lubricus]
MTHLNRLVAWFEQLSPTSLEDIATIYHANSYFKDPFNEFYQRDELKKLFANMFEKLQNPRFVIEETISQSNSTFIVWHFDFSLRQRRLQIKGSSHIKFDETGLVTYHRDYWDAAEELYEKLPVIGYVFKQLKKIGH